MCHFHVVASSLLLPRCRCFTGGVTFKFLTKILAAALLFYNVLLQFCYFVDVNN